MKIRAVSLDAGGTLLEPWPSVGHIYARIAYEFGAPEIDPALLSAKFNAAWKSARAFDYSKESWREIVEQSFGSTWAVNSELFEAIYAGFNESRCWHVFEDVVPTLRELSGKNIRLCVVSNWDERLPLLLRNLNLRAYFEEVFYSAHFGVHKPDPRYFRECMDLMELEPSEVLHVGDGHGEDFMGAKSAGMNALWLNREGSDAPGAIESLKQIAPLLEA